MNRCRWMRINALVQVDVKMSSRWTRRDENVYGLWGKETTTFRKNNMNFGSKTIITTLPLHNKLANPKSSYPKTPGIKKTKEPQQISHENGNTKTPNTTITKINNIISAGGKQKKVKTSQEKKRNHTVSSTSTSSIFKNKTNATNKPRKQHHQHNSQKQQKNNRKHYFFKKDTQNIKNSAEKNTTPRY